MGGRYVLEVSNSKYPQKLAGLGYSYLALGISSDVLAIADAMSVLAAGILLR